MANDGVRSPNIPQAALIDDLLGNRNGSTARIPMETVATQLLASGPFQILTNANKLFPTYAALAAATVGDYTPWVYADPDPDKNGIYRRVAPNWVWSLPLPYSFIKAENAGAGSANAIQATTTIPVSEAALIILPIAATNTASPVTVSFNGGVALTAKTNSNNDIPVGGLVAGMQVLATIYGDELRLATDIVSGSIIAVAEGILSDTEDQADAAASSSLLASKFANNAEDAEVVPGSGLFSTKHYLAKVTALYSAVISGIAGAINGATSKSVLDDNDRLAGTDSANGYSLFRFTVANLVASIFRTTRTISAAQFASASFKLFNAAGTPRALTFDTTALTADRVITVPNKAVDLGNVRPLAESGNLTVSLGGTVSFTHGLGSVAKDYRAFAICAVADIGFAIGDEIELRPDWGNVSGGYGVLLWVDNATQIKARFGNTAIGVAFNKGTGAAALLTTGSWNVIIRAKP